MSQDTISRSALLDILGGLDGEEKQRFEAMLGAMGVKVPQRKKHSGYTVKKVIVPKEYYLNWHIKCKLCGFEEDFYFYMKYDKERTCLISEPIESHKIIEYTLVNWRTEQKQRETCPRCLSHLKGVPHKEVCELLVKAKGILSEIPIF